MSKRREKRRKKKVTQKCKNSWNTLSKCEDNVGTQKTINNGQ